MCLYFYANKKEGTLKIFLNMDVKKYMGLSKEKAGALPAMQINNAFASGNDGH